MVMFLEDNYSIDWNDIIQTLATSVSALVAIFSLIVSIVTVFFVYKEYNRMKRYKQCEVLSKYNERYMSDPYISKVINYYLTKNTNELPTVFEKEMFLRFYEELEQMIRGGYISEEDVNSYFSYYFMILWNDKDFFWDNEMIEPYRDMKSAQQAFEWNMAKKLYDRFFQFRK